jgi:hypothetical protein
MTDKQTQKPNYAQKAFHEHLDKCEQCSKNPFALCPVGDCLITKAAQWLAL